MMTSQVPFISVLVPAYNVERYVRQSLESLQSQTFGSFEALLINDGSTDGTLRILQEFAETDSRFHVIDKENSGYGASMNIGLSRACGSYVAILEPDDLYAPQALERLFSSVANSGADVSKGNFWLYWSKPTERKQFFSFIEKDWDGETCDPLERKEFFFRKPSIWSGLYRRDFLERNNIRFLETPGASFQDASFNFKVWACAKRVACVYDGILLYRQDNDQSSVNSTRKIYCVCDEYREMYRFVETLPVALRGTLRASLDLMKLNTYLWNYDRLSGEAKREFLEFAHEEFHSALADESVDFSLFNEYEHADYQAIANRPRAFEWARLRFMHDGQVDVLPYYFSIGGFPQIARIALAKIVRKR